MLFLMFRLAQRKTNHIERNVIKHSTFKEYKLRKSKAFIDELDDLICPLYGLTEEETNFIKNYEIKFRLEDETADDAGK